jgi:hypothetical protein
MVSGQSRCWPLVQEGTQRIAIPPRWPPASGLGTTLTDAEDAAAPRQGQPAVFPMFSRWSVQISARHVRTSCFHWLQPLLVKRITLSPVMCPLVSPENGHGEVGTSDRHPSRRQRGHLGAGQLRLLARPEQKQVITCRTANPGSPSLSGVNSAFWPALASVRSSLTDLDTRWPGRSGTVGACWQSRLLSRFPLCYHHRS